MKLYEALAQELQIEPHRVAGALLEIDCTLIRNSALGHLIATHEGHCEVFGPRPVDILEAKP